MMMNHRAFDLRWLRVGFDEMAYRARGVARNFSTSFLGKLEPNGFWRLSQ